MALRDARYLDGWILAGGMLAQVIFHVGVKSSRISPRVILRWRSLHVFLGYVLIVVFLSHVNFSLPETALEWALWIGFVSITISGVLGTYLSWLMRAKSGLDAGMGREHIAARREDLAREVHAAATQMDGSSDTLPLPTPPYDAWILDLYANHLKEFFQKPGSALAHLIGSQRPMKRILNEIDAFSMFVDGPRQERLRAIKELVIERDRLDFARVILGLRRGWLFLHVPVTYGLTVLVILHGVSAYAFSSGAW
jgi:hypothetical protein